MTVRPRSLYAMALAMNTATGVVVVAAPLLAIRFGAAPIQLGLLGSLSALAYTLVCPLAGRYSDSRPGDSRISGAEGRRRSLLMSCALLAAVDCFVFFVSRLRDVFFLTVCASFAAGFFWVPLQAWLAEIRGRLELSRRLGGFNLSWSLGIMAGPAIGGYLYGFDYRLPWCYGAAVAVLILSFLLASGGTGELAVVEVASAEQDADRPGRRASFLALARWANFVCWFSLANVQALYPKLAVERGFSPELIGYLLFLVGAAQSAFFVVLGASSFWHYRHLPLVAAHGLAAAGLLGIFGFSSIGALSASFPLIGIALALSYYSSIYYSLDISGGRGRRAGIHEFIVGSGFLLGPIIGGAIAEWLGLRAPFLLCAVLLAATGAAEAVIASRPE